MNMKTFDDMSLQGKSFLMCVKQIEIEIVAETAVLVPIWENSLLSGRLDIWHQIFSPPCIVTDPEDCSRSTRLCY